MACTPPPCVTALPPKADRTETLSLTEVRDVLLSIHLWGTRVHKLMSVRCFVRARSVLCYWQQLIASMLHALTYVAFVYSCHWLVRHYMVPPGHSNCACTQWVHMVWDSHE
jgi:hypothetical protein